MSRLLLSGLSVAVVILCLVSPAHAAAPIDPVAVTLTSPAAVAATRTALIEETWGRTTLPTTLPAVTRIANPFGSTLPRVGAVYQYLAVMSNRQVNASNLYVNSNPNGSVVILNMGHQGTASWQTFDPIYGTVPLMTALLTNGFSVYAMNMPAAGQCCTAHPLLFAQYGNAAMQYFLEPAVQAINYWQLHGMFSQFDAVGISGGGWTAQILQALDPRIKTVIETSGSLPGTEFCCQSFAISQLPNQGDHSFAAEQSWAPFYSIAGYVDLYLMGASGPGRTQRQIMLVNDDCCMGPRQWNNIYVNANDGRNWYQQLGYYQSLINNAAANIPNNFSVVLDNVAQSHQFSDPFAVNLTLQTLLGGASP